MRKEEIKMMKLLSEIDNACNEAQVMYYLIEKELLSQFRPGRIYEAESDICMLYQDYIKILPKIKKEKHRKIESIRNNIDMPGMYFRYIDTESFMYVQRYRKVRKYPGIAINIHILRADNGDSKSLSDIESMMESDIDGITKNDTTDLNSMKRVSLLFKHNMMSLLERASLSDLGEKSVLKIPESQPINFPKGFWKKQTDITIGKYSFKTTANAQQYLLLRYGEEYETMRMVSLLTNYQVLANCKVPYKSVVKKIESFFDEDPNYRGAHERFIAFFNDEYADMLKQESEDWDVLFFVGARISMWKKYNAQRDKIKELLDDGRKDEVFIILRDYYDAFKGQLKKGRVLFFDKEFYDVSLALWRECGYEDMVAEAESLAETQELIPVLEDELKSASPDDRFIETVRIRNIR